MVSGGRGGDVIFYINPVIALRTPVQGGAPAGPAGLSSPAGSRARAVPAPGARSHPAIPQAGAAISCPGRECAGPEAADRRRTPAERGARTAADAPGHLPPIRPAAAGPLRQRGRLPEGLPAGKAAPRPGSLTGSARSPSRGSGSSPGKGKGSPSVPRSSDLDWVWQRGRGVFAPWTDAL